MKKHLVVTAAAALFIGAMTACTSGGSSSQSGPSLSGTVAGTTFGVASQVAAVGPVEETCAGSADGGATCSSHGQSVGVILTNRRELTCAALNTTATSYANADALALTVLDATGNVSPGTYDISPDAGLNASPAAFAAFKTTTSTCGDGLDLSATGGTIVLTDVSSSHVAGTFDVTFGSQGSFSGSFDVDTCTLPDGGLSTASGDGGVACQP